MLFVHHVQVLDNLKGLLSLLLSQNQIICEGNYIEFVRIKLVDFGSHLSELQKLVKPRNYQCRIIRNAQL